MNIKGLSEIPKSASAPTPELITINQLLQETISRCYYLALSIKDKANMIVPISNVSTDMSKSEDNFVNSSISSELWLRHSEVSKLERTLDEIYTHLCQIV